MVEWDESVATHQHRLNETRQLLKKVTVNIKASQVVLPVPLFVKDPMVVWPLTAAPEAAPPKRCPIVGHEHDDTDDAIACTEWVLENWNDLKGTGIEITEEFRAFAKAKGYV